VAGDKGLVVLPAQIELAREDHESEEFADIDSHIPRASWSIKKILVTTYQNIAIVHPSSALTFSLDFLPVF